MKPLLRLPVAPLPPHGKAASLDVVGRVPSHGKAAPFDAVGRVPPHGEGASFDVVGRVPSHGEAASLDVVGRVPSQCIGRLNPSLPGTAVHRHIPPAPTHNTTPHTMPTRRSQAYSLASLLLMLSFESLVPCLPLHADLKVPSSTAYATPHHNLPEFKESVGITRWSNPDTRFVWYGNLTTTGKLSCSIELDRSSNLTGSMQLSVNGAPRRVTITSTPASSPSALDFGEFDIIQPGFHRFELSLIGPISASGLSVSALSLSGPASEKAHFNLKPHATQPRSTSPTPSPPTNKSLDSTARSPPKRTQSTPITWLVVGIKVTSVCRSIAPPNAESSSASGTAVMKQSTAKRSKPKTA